MDGSLSHYGIEVFVLDLLVNSTTSGWEHKGKKDVVGRSMSAKSVSAVTSKEMYKRYFL